MSTNSLPSPVSSSRRSREPSWAEPPPLPKFSERYPEDDDDPTLARPGELSDRLARALRGAPARTSAKTRRLTTMVRISHGGRVFAARGKGAAQLVNAAALIHRLAQLIAVDLGQQACGAVHLRGAGESLLVARSEVGDVAAVRGRSGRMSGLLARVGQR